MKILLVIVGYLAISFSQSLDRARNADEAEIKRLTNVKINCSTDRFSHCTSLMPHRQIFAQSDLETAQSDLETAQLEATADAAGIFQLRRAKRANDLVLASELQSILLSVDETRSDILREIQKNLALMLR